MLLPGEKPPTARNGRPLSPRELRGRRAVPTARQKALVNGPRPDPPTAPCSEHLPVRVLVKDGKALTAEGAALMRKR